LLPAGEARTLPAVHDGEEAEMILLTISTALSLAVAQPAFEDTVRCLALDDTYWVMIMSAGAGERTEADMAWRQKTEKRMYAEGAKKGLNKDQVNASYSAVFNPFQETFLDDKLMAERNKCRAAKS
jgi:hypothetical protein